MRFALIALLLCFVSIFVLGCEAAEKYSENINHAASQVENFAQENPNIDALASGGISTAALLLYSIGSTVGLFKRNKDAKDRAEIIDDILGDKNNNVSLENLPSKKARKIAAQLHNQ